MGIKTTTQRKTLNFLGLIIGGVSKYNKQLLWMRLFNEKYNGVGKTGTFIPSSLLTNGAIVKGVLS